MLNRGVEIKFLGHGTFLFKTPGGKSLIIDPWLSENPSCPEADRKIESLDTMLITHGQFGVRGPRTPSDPGATYGSEGGAFSAAPGGRWEEPIMKIRRTPCFRAIWNKFRMATP